MKSLDQKKDVKPHPVESSPFPVPEGAESSIYINYYDALRRYLTRRLQSKEDVEDAVQEVYLRVIKHHKPRFSPSLAFLFRIASNLLKDNFRKRQTRSLDAHIPIEEAVLVSDSETPEEALRSKEGMAAIRQIFRNLSPTYRRVFLLHRVRGLTYDQIADEVGLTKHQVKNYVYHVLIQIRTIIGEYI